MGRVGAEGKCEEDGIILAQAENQSICYVTSVASACALKIQAFRSFGPMPDGCKDPAEDPHENAGRINAREKVGPAEGPAIRFL